jgi:hypothetical protein
VDSTVEVVSEVTVLVGTSTGTTGVCQSNSFQFPLSSRLTCRLAPVGDDLGGAAAALLGLGGDGRGRVVKAPVVEALVGVTAHMDISNGGAGESGRGGQDSSPHDESKVNKRLYINR